MSLTAAYRGGFEDRPGWWLSFTYSAETVEAVKQMIPHTERSWNADRKEWWVASQYEDVLLKLWPSFAAYQQQRQLL